MISEIIEKLTPNQGMQIHVPQSVLEKLLAIKHRMGLSDAISVVKRAIAVYDLITAHHVSGHEIILRKRDTAHETVLNLNGEPDEQDNH